MRPWGQLATAILLAGLVFSSRALATAPPCVAPCIVTNDYNTVKHSVTTVNKLTVDHYMWFDSKKLPRTLSLKREGNGNPGHGGYAVQMTYVLSGQNPKPHYYTVTVNAETTNDGGFGYFVSHERERQFKDGSTGTIANKVFGVDDSPLGLDFAVTESFPASSASTASAAIRYQTTYHHYGTLTPDKVDPNTGLDSTPLPLTQSSYKRYALPVTMTWLIQALKDDPRYIVNVDLSQIGGADLVNFDMRAPYGVMVYDNGLDGTINYAGWGDQAYIFQQASAPITRSTKWTWNTPNKGGRFNFLRGNGYEIGIYEPVEASNSALADSYSAERGYTTQSYAAAGDKSYDSCAIETSETLPEDGEWPDQSVQYSLPCPTADTAAAIHVALTTPTTFKKLAWGSSPYYGSSLDFTYNGRKAFKFDGYPKSGSLRYVTCISVGQAVGDGLTRLKASGYQTGNPGKVAPVCAAATTGVGEE